MTSLNNKYTNNRSMNGLISIYADNIEVNDSIVNDTLIIDGKDITTTINQVETNKTNLTGISYIGTPIPMTKVSNYFDVFGNTTLKILDVSGSSTFRGQTNNGIATFNSPIICN